MKQPTTRQKIVTCCIHLSWDYVPKAFMASYFSMWKHSVGKYDLKMVTCNGCEMDRARDELTKGALEGNPDYILWLDADQTYPKDTPEVLMKHIDAGKLIVGGVSPLKREGEPQDGKPSVWDINDDTGRGNLREISLNQGLIKVDAMGLGGVMTNPTVFNTLKYSWFCRMWNTEKAYRVGVDFQFFGNCKRAGINVWCDTDLIYGHIAVRPIKMNVKETMVEF